MNKVQKWLTRELYFIINSLRLNEKASWVSYRFLTGRNTASLNCWTTFAISCEDKLWLESMFSWTKRCTSLTWFLKSFYKVKYNVRKIWKERLFVQEHTVSHWTEFGFTPRTDHRNLEKGRLVLFAWFKTVLCFLTVRPMRLLVGLNMNLWDLSLKYVEVNKKSRQIFAFASCRP